MYPDLSYLLHDLLGTPVDNWTAIFKTFGILLVSAILVAAYLLWLELKRKAGEGIYEGEEVTEKIGLGPQPADIIGNAIFGFILGFKLVYVLQHFDDFQKDAADILLSMKGNWWAGIALALLFAGYRFWEQQRKKLPKPEVRTKKLYPHDRIGDITMVAAISGLIGAKFFAIIEDLPTFFADPLGTFFSGSGLAIYGGLIGGFIGASIYLRRKNIPIAHSLDAVAPALIIAYGVGRLGCHFSGDGDWGIVNSLASPNWWFLPDWLWSYEYPRNVLKEGVLIEGCEGLYCRKLSPPVYPTAIYETIMALSIGAILWAIRKRITIPGLLFFIYLIFNGLERFWIEKIRVNIDYQYFGLKFTQAELISTLIFFTGIVGCIVLLLRKRT